MQACDISAAVLGVWLIVFFYNGFELKYQFNRKLDGMTVSSSSSREVGYDTIHYIAWANVCLDLISVVIVITVTTP